MTLSVRVLLPEPVHVPLLDVGEVVGAKVGVGGGSSDCMLRRTMGQRCGARTLLC